MPLEDSVFTLDDERQDEKEEFEDVIKEFLDNVHGDDIKEIYRLSIGQELL